MSGWYCITEDCLQWFYGRKGVSLELFLVLCQRAAFVSNEVDIYARDLDAIGDKLGLKTYSVKRGIQALVRAGCLKKISTGFYVVNPRLCFRGSPARAQAIWYRHGFPDMK